MTFTPEKIQELREARRLALFTKWAAGTRLNETELGEISDIIAPKPMEPAPVAAPSVPSTPPPALVLEATSEEKTVTRSGCRHPIVPGSPYEKIFEAQIRTIKRWRSIGMAAKPPEPPPLDEAWKMAEWFRVHMKRRVPERLEELERAGPPRPASVGVRGATALEETKEGAGGEAGKAPSASGPVRPGSLPCAATPLPLPSSPSGHVATVTPPALATGYAATLARFERAEAIAAQRYFDAFESPDESVRATASGLKREWDEVANTYRSYAKDSSKILRDLGDVWDSAAVRSAITDIHNVIAPGIRRLLKRFRDKNPAMAAALDGVAPPSVQQESFDRMVDQLFAALGNSSFTSTTLPEPPSLSADPHLAAA